MADLNKLKNIYNSDNDYNADTGTDYLSLYRAKKQQWGGSNVSPQQNSYISNEERNKQIEDDIRRETQAYYSNPVDRKIKTNTPTVVPSQETEEQKMQRFISPDYKMTKEEINQAKEYAQQLQKDFNSGKFKNDPKAMEKYELMTNLQNKSSLKGQISQGIGGSFKPIMDLTAMISPDIDKQSYEERSNQVFDAQKTQNPLAYNTGYAAGKMGQYAVGSRIAGAIPGVNLVAGKLGGAIGKGVSSATAGKIAAETAGKVATNVIGDTLLDIALDTAPEAISNTYKGKTASEISQDAFKNIATNIGFNLGGEALGGIFNAIKSRKLNTQELDVAQEALKQMDDVQKSAIADSVGFKSVDELDNAVKPQEVVEDVVSDTVKVTPRKLTQEEIAENTLKENKAVNNVNLPKQQVTDINKPKQAVIANDKYIASEVEKLPELTAPIKERMVKQQPIIDGDYKRRSYEDTLANKSNLPDDLKNALVEEEALYKVLHNKETIQKAGDILSTGFDNSLKEFNRLVDLKSPEALPLGNEIARQYIEQGNREAAVEVVKKMSEQLTKSGQFTQAAAISLMQNDPMTAFRFIQRDIDKLNEQGLKRYKGKWKDFNLTDEEAEMFNNIAPGDTEAIKNAFESVGKRLSKEYPSSLIEKLTELRRVSWLLNPRTNVRNVASNLLLKPLTDASYKISALGQNAYKLIDKDFKPNQAVLVTKDAKNIANNVWDTVKDSFDETSKYLETGKTLNIDKQVFKEGTPTQIFNNLFPGVLDKINAKMGKDSAGILETLRNVTYDLLQQGDTPFVEKAFKSRLGSYIQAQGIKNIDDVPPEAITIAYQEALRAAFKDDTALSTTLRNLKKNMGVAGEVVLPFTKTPANIAMRGIDYSPAGLVNTFKKAKNGADVSLIIDELSKNLTGTGLIVVGAMLANKGIITADLSDNKKQAAFQKQQGMQPFSVKIGNKYHAYDWAQPASIPLIIGATIATSDDDIGKTAFDVGKNAVTNAADAWFGLSPVQSLADILGGSGSISQRIGNELLEIPGGFIPSALGATSKVADTTQRVTYSKDNALGTQANIAKSKVPGLSQTLPAAYDTWGREIKRDNSTGEAVVSQYLNPGRTTTEKSTPIDKEINRLYEQLGDENIYPTKASYTIQKQGERYNLDNKEYSQYQKVMGENSYNGVNAFMKSPAYNKLSDEQKSKIIKNIYSNAKQIADYDILQSRGVTSEKETETKIKKVYLNYSPENVANYFVAKEIIDNSESRKTPSGKAIPGTAKQNAINNLIDIGYTRAEATRIYGKIRNKD